MNKLQAFKDTKSIYPGLRPSRASGFTLTNDGKGVIIAGMEEPVALVLYSMTDLSRLMNTCQEAMSKIEEQKLWDSIPTSASLPDTTWD